MELSYEHGVKVARQIGFNPIKCLYFEDVTLPSNGQKLDLSLLPKGLFKKEKPHLKIMIKDLFPISPAKL